MAEGYEVVASLEALQAQINARLESIKAWLMALTGLSTAQLVVLVAMVLTQARR